MTWKNIGNAEKAKMRKAFSITSQLVCGFCIVVPRKIYRPESIDDPSKQMILTLCSLIVAYLVRNIVE